MKPTTFDSSTRDTVYRFGRPAHYLALLLIAAAGANAQERSEPTRGNVDLSESQLHYEVFHHESTSEEPLVVLLHGGNLDLRMWDDQIEPLINAFEIIRYDIRPFGRSGPQTEGFSHVEDLRRLLDHLEVEKAHLVGLSLGGRIALDFALEHPERVERIVVAAPGLTGFEASLDPALAAAVSAAQAGEPERAAELSLDMAYLGPAMEQPTLAKRMRKLVMDNANAWARPRLPERLPDPPTIERLTEIRTPALILLGGRDLPDIHEIVERLADELPNAERVILPDAGHMLNMEAPAEFNRLVRDFLLEAEPDATEPQ